MSDLAFVLGVFAFIVFFAVVTYFKTIPTSRIFHFLQKPEWMAVFLMPLIFIAFGVHLPNHIFGLLILAILLFCFRSFFIPCNPGGHQSQRARCFLRRVMAAE